MEGFNFANIPAETREIAIARVEAQRQETETRYRALVGEKANGYVGANLDEQISVLNRKLGHFEFTLEGLRAA